MAMTLSIPPTHSSASSPVSDDSSILPPTPISPSMQTLSLPSASANALQLNNSTTSNSSKRKPSRRANTAERRATHNAVERQRRETLNGRFLDLAGLLPNLSQIRRPSKSSIVNSSIAHIHASRRHRLLAARELRLLKLESDALRRELNEWRDRAGLPRVEEPVRGEGFAMVLSGEIEVLATIHDEDEDVHGYDGFDDQDDDYGAISGAQLEDGGDDSRLAQQAAAAMLKNVSSTPFSHNMPSGANSHNMIHPRPTHGGPTIVTNPSSVSFENPAMASLYEPHSQGFANGGNIFMQPPQQQPSPPHDMEKGTWNPQVFLSTPQGQHQMLQARSFLPPHHSMSNPPSASVNPPANPFNDIALFANFQRQQSQQMSGLHGYASDDASSVGSMGSGRQRSRSLSGNGAGYCTPPLGSPTGSYDLSSSVESLGGTGMGGGDFVMVPRRLSPSGLQHSAATAAWCQQNDGVTDGLGMMKHNSSLSVGGGGSGGFLMMM